MQCVVCGMCKGAAVTCLMREMRCSHPLQRRTALAVRIVSETEYGRVLGKHVANGADSLFGKNHKLIREFFSKPSENRLMRDFCNASGGLPALTTRREWRQLERYIPLVDTRRAPKSRAYLTILGSKGSTNGFSQYRRIGTWYVCRRRKAMLHGPKIHKEVRFLLRAGGQNGKIPIP